MDPKELKAKETGPGPERSEPQNPQIIGITRKGENNQPPIPDVLPILPVRNLVIFPGTVVPLTVGRSSSRKLLDDSLPQSKVLGLVTQRNPEQNDPALEDLYPVGVAAQVLKLMRQGPASVVIVIQALHRVRLRRALLTHPYLRAEVEVLHSSAPPVADKQWEATLANVRDTARRLLELTPDAPNEAQVLLSNIEDPGLLADFLASNLNLDLAQKQDLLEETDVVKRVRAWSAPGKFWTATTTTWTRSNGG